MTTTASNQTRFSKLDDGSWGVSFLPGQHSPGDRIRVRKANGEYREVIVGSLDHVDRGAWNKDAPNGRAYHRSGGDLQSHQHDLLDNARHRSERKRLPGTGGVTAATDKQVKYIVALGGTPEPGLTKRAASSLIDELKGGTRRNDPLTGRPFASRELEDKQNRIDREERAESRRLADSEIRGGEAACALAQQAGPAGSEAREAAYLAQEMADYNAGF